MWKKNFKKMKSMRKAWRRGTFSFQLSSMERLTNRFFKHETSVLKHGTSDELKKEKKNNWSSGFRIVNLARSNS